MCKCVCVLGHTQFWLCLVNCGIPPVDLQSIGHFICSLDVDGQLFGLPAKFDSSTMGTTIVAKKWKFKHCFAVKRMKRKCQCQVAAYSLRFFLANVMNFRYSPFFTNFHSHSFHLHSSNSTSRQLQRTSFI